MRTAPATATVSKTPASTRSAAITRLIAATTRSLRLMLLPPPADNIPTGSIGRREVPLEIEGAPAEQLQAQARGLLRAALTRADGGDVLGVQHRRRLGGVAPGDPSAGGRAARSAGALRGAGRACAGAGRALRALPAPPARA